MKIEQISTETLARDHENACEAVDALYEVSSAHGAYDGAMGRALEAARDLADDIYGELRTRERCEPHYGPTGTEPKPPADSNPDAPQHAWSIYGRDIGPLIRGEAEPSAGRSDAESAGVSLRIELANCTETLLREIDCESLTPRDIAQTYALALRSSEDAHWPTVNRAIVCRWDEETLEEIKALAWSGEAYDHTEPQ